MSWSSLRARSPAVEISCRTVTKTSGPERALLLAMSAISERRVATSPTRSGLTNVSRPPAHIRRGRATGGRKPPRRGWPSGPISLWRAIGE
jgi:hypothetical protein